MQVARSARSQVGRLGLRQRRIVTSASTTRFVCFMGNSERPAIPSHNNITTNRLSQLHRQLATSQSGEYNMASDNARSHNNDDFQLNTLFNVKDKVALVTGGGTGIGLMAVQALAVNGAKVYICGRTEEK